MTLPDLPQFFDLSADYSVAEGRLPHWEQAGVVVFVTFRTWDSMPREVVEELLRERTEWLRSRGIDPARAGWEAAVDRLPAHERVAFRRFRSSRWEESLDGCRGSCPLRRPDCSRVVADSLAHFDGDRYRLFDFVVMPNHAHVLASFLEEGAMRRQCESWKHYTAVRLNKLLGRSGRFWEAESFDHLVRSAEQFEYLRDYVATNPAAAGLGSGEFRHYSRDLGTSPPRTALPLAERADHTTGEHP